jgi:Ca2+-binding EF-hand superfamily protein
MADKHAEGTAGMASGVAAGQGSETGKAPVAEGLKHQLSAFGALSGVTPVKKEGAQKTPDASQGNAPEKAAAVAQGRRRPPPPAASSASGGDLLRQISGISENVSKPESEDARGRGAIKDVSFGKDEIRILSPSGRMVSEVFDKLQQDIVAAMHAKETTLLRSFQFLNRAGRERGVAKIEAVLAELTALLNLDSHNPDADARATLELLNNLVRQHDADGNGSISFGEFIGMCGGATSRSALRGSGGIDGSAVAAEVAEALAGKFTTAKQVFKVMNTGRSNEISSDMLVRACEKAGMVLAPEEMEALFPLIDADKSGRLTYDEVTMLMEYGSTTFEANRALAAQEKQRVKEVAVVCKQMQDACSEREAMERLIEASQTVVPRAKLGMAPLLC